MKEPIARPTRPTSKAEEDTREPKAFTAPAHSDTVTDFVEPPAEPDLILPPAPRRSWPFRLLLWSGGLLLSLGLALAAERLIGDLFARYEALGWIGIGATALLVLALVLLAAREVMAVWRHANLDSLRLRAEAVLASNRLDEADAIRAALLRLYASRPDLARARRRLEQGSSDSFDGSDVIKTCERALMAPLDARARTLTAASARRVALVTAVSPRALFDVAFVSYESFRLARAIAAIYGARPGFIGAWKLLSAILGHLAVTGGVALGDTVIQQLIGHGLAARLSARLGEGLVNGMMTVRVGIAAMRVTRPLPFAAVSQPVVMDFAADIARTSRAGATGE